MKTVLTTLALTMAAVSAQAMENPQQPYGVNCEQLEEAARIYLDRVNLEANKKAGWDSPVG